LFLDIILVTGFKVNKNVRNYREVRNTNYYKIYYSTNNICIRGLNKGFVIFQWGIKIMWRKKTK
jgi:hypothetical protein